MCSTLMLIILVPLSVLNLQIAYMSRQPTCDKRQGLHENYPYFNKLNDYSTTTNRAINLSFQSYFSIECLTFLIALILFN